MLYCREFTRQKANWLLPEDYVKSNMLAGIAHMQTPATKLTLCRNRCEIPPITYCIVVLTVRETILESS